MGGWWITVLGAAAGLCTVGSFVPQVVKAWREGDTNAISLRMYLVLVAGFVLWLGYGVLIGSWPIILVNAGNLVLSAAILRLKLRDGKGAGSVASRRSWVAPKRGPGRPRKVPVAVALRRTSGPAAVGARPHPGRPEAEPAAPPEPLTTARVRVAVTDWGAAFHSRQPRWVPA